MVTETRLSNAEYLALAMAEPDRKLELHDGVLREKPGTTYAHYCLETKLGFALMSQLDWSHNQVRTDAGLVHRPASTFFIPDVFVLPAVYTKPFRDRDDILEVYDQPLPLVVEIWSRSTGDYDVEMKLAVYKQRGNLEVWYIHPFKRTLIAWRRQPDGTYSEEIIREGVVTLAALPGVSIDLDKLFND